MSDKRQEDFILTADDGLSKRSQTLTDSRRVTRVGMVNRRSRRRYHLPGSSYPQFYKLFTIFQKKLPGTPRKLEAVIAVRCLRLIR